MGCQFLVGRDPTFSFLHKSPAPNTQKELRIYFWLKKCWTFFLQLEGTTLPSLTHQVCIKHQCHTGHYNPLGMGPVKLCPQGTLSPMRDQTTDKYLETAPNARSNSDEGNNGQFKYHSWRRQYPTLSSKWTMRQNHQQGCRRLKQCCRSTWPKWRLQDSHPTRAENMFFSSTHGTFSRIYCMSGHKRVSLNLKRLKPHKVHSSTQWNFKSAAEGSLKKSQILGN